MLLSKMKLQISFVRENTKRNNLFISSNYHDLNVGIYILCSHQIILSLEIQTDHTLEENYLSDLQKNGSAGILHSVFYGHVFVGLVIYFRTHSRAAIYIYAWHLTQSSGTIHKLWTTGFKIQALLLRAVSSLISTIGILW